MIIDEDFWMNFSLIATGIIILFLITFIIVDTATRSCIKYEDVCYKTVCSKGCWDVPTSCSNNRVKGHKNMCVISKSIFFTKDYTK